MRDVSDEGIGLFCHAPIQAEFAGVLLKNDGCDDDLLIVFEVRRCQQVGIYYDIAGKCVTTAMLPTEL